MVTRLVATEVERAHNRSCEQNMNSLTCRMGYDVRAIANIILDLADARGYSISNMKINKIVFFLHAEYLALNGKPLVSAKIEAWEHGPVFRELYREFKIFDDGPISSRATYVDPYSGIRGVASAQLNQLDLDFINATAPKYVKMSAAALRAESHVADGPWDRVWHHQTEINPTMRITDESILEWYESSARH